MNNIKIGTLEENLLTLIWNTRVDASGYKIKDYTTSKYIERLVKKIVKLYESSNS